MNDWIGVAYLILIVSVYSSMIYYVIKIRNVIDFDLSFLVSRKFIIKKRLKYMIVLSLLVAFINSIVFAMALDISNTENYGIIYNIFAGFLFFFGFDICILNMETFSLGINNIQIKTVIYFIINFGVALFIIIVLTKRAIWEFYFSAGTIMLFISLILIYTGIVMYKKCDIS